MRNASLQRCIREWAIPIFVAILLTSAASFTVVRAVILLGQVSPLVTSSRAGALHSS